MKGRCILSSGFFELLKSFAKETTSKFSARVDFNPEDQLKGTVCNFMQAAGDLVKAKVTTVTEVQMVEIGGRPDIGVLTRGVLTGHIELKAPGKGADPAKLKGRDKEQWEKFKNLPNVIYTDGNQWGLYRTGERVGNVVRLSGDVTAGGARAVDQVDADRLWVLLADFLEWEPIVPKSPKALAKCLAPLCRLLRAEVLAVLKQPDSNLSVLARDWRKYLFPEADDEQFADAYAETLTYALLLAEFSGADSLTIETAARRLRPATGCSLMRSKFLAMKTPRPRLRCRLGCWNG